MLVLKEQAREIAQESGTSMRRIMSGRGFVDYSENGEQIHTHTDTHTGVPIESVPD